MRCRPTFLNCLFVAFLLPALTSCASDVPPPPASTPPAIAEYTVVGKATYTGNDSSGKRGWYVTIVPLGNEREVEVGSPCYNAARVGQVLPRTAELPRPGGDGTLTFTCR